ncbi:MAG: dephospho-CoA kinase [Candidatus Eremiobacteraeota bacterium]|nr:dephospho-CoA kinase [Candidatus Eremiobacteraeota bacterium]
MGLTGGIGSGKSEVARIFARLGAQIVDADEIAREVVAPGTSGFSEVAARWPQVIRDGEIDRPALAAIVFADPREREALNAIVHPRVRMRAAEIEREAGSAIVVHVVPLLFEGDFWKQCAATVVVIAPVETRIARVERRDGLARDAIERRMAAQIDPDVARGRATYVIENDGNLSALGSASRAVWESLRARYYRPPEQSAR